MNKIFFQPLQLNLITQNHQKNTFVVLLVQYKTLKTMEIVVIGYHDFIQVNVCVWEQSTVKESTKGILDLQRNQKDDPKLIMSSFNQEKLHKTSLQSGLGLMYKISILFIIMLMSQQALTWLLYLCLNFCEGNLW